MELEYGPWSFCVVKHKLVTTFHVVTSDWALGFVSDLSQVEALGFFVQIEDDDDARGRERFIGPWAMNMRPWAYLDFVTT